MGSYIIRNARVIDPAGKRDGPADILMADGKIAGIGEGLSAAGATVVDAAGRIAAPGLVDLHTHLREPGREDKETIASGTRAAVRGGFTGVCCMPNTDPAIDSPETVRLVLALAEKSAACRVSVIAAITKGRAGAELTDLPGLRRAGAVAVSDDGSSIEDAAVMARSLEAAKKAGLPVICHCEDTTLSAKGVVNRGFISTKTGMRGIPRASEYERVRRDIGLAAKAGAPLHIAHVSCRESVDIIRQAKKDGIAVTAETCPHYFTLTDECCVTYDTNTKMNPPLRTAQDVQAIKEGLRDGTIDAIATDHAPHTDSEKDVEFDHAPFGTIGLETALALSVMELVDTKVLSWPALIACLSANPARIAGLPAGALAKGAKADIVIIDPAASWTYGRGAIESQSKNSPFIGWTLKARATDVFVGGRPALRDGKIV